MINIKRQLVVLLALISCALPIHAALYRVVEMATPTDAEESYGVGIKKETGSTDCFSTSCDENSYSFAGDTRNADEGVDYKEEVLFAFDKWFYYLDYDDIEDYCDEELGYATCEYWADSRWYGDTDTGIGGLQNEREAYWEADYQTNATAYSGFSGLLSTVDFDADAGSDAPDSTDDDGATVYSSVSDTNDRVFNAFDADGYVIGNTSSGYYEYGDYYIRMYRSRGYYSTGLTQYVLEPEADTSLTFADSTAEQTLVSQMGQTMAFDSFEYDGVTYVVGSAAVATFYWDDDDKDYDSENTSDSDYEDVSECVDNDYDDPAFYPECQNFGFATRAFIWNVSAGTPNASGNHFSVADWDTDSSEYYEYDDYEASAQASVRGATIADDGGDYDGLPVLVGYNTELDDDDFFMMQAAIFRPSETTEFSVGEDEWTSVFIEDATVEVDGDYIHSNSIATDINENMIVIGYAKRDGDYPYDGVTDKRMFLTDANDSTPTAAFFNDTGEDIFFDSAGGDANAINNYNEIVGQVDAEDHREVSGKQRDHRGFIYPYNDTGTDTTRRARFSNQAWWLDDLTNGGTYSSANNHFRIIDAGDINDAGVIAATAIQCYASESATTSMEYDSTEHFAYCNDGEGDERITAVMLIPIDGATSDDISEREEDSSTVTRSGAGLHWGYFILLLFIGYIQTKYRKWCSKPVS